MSVLLSTAPTPSGIYSLSLHDALPIYLLIESEREPAIGAFRYDVHRSRHRKCVADKGRLACNLDADERRLFLLFRDALRSEEHTSELQSHVNLVCRLLLEKKKVERPDT